MPTNVTDTDKKILIKDHDILIATYTLQQDMIRRLDEYILLDRQKHDQTVMEMRELAINQTRINGDIEGLKSGQSSLHGRIDKLDAKSLRIDLAILAGTIVAGVIAWFKG